MRNTRFITAIIAFIATFAVSVGLVWLLFGFPVKSNDNYSSHNCQEHYSSAIYSHLRRDITNGRERDARSFRSNNSEKDGKVGYSIKIHANSVSQYVEDSSSMDVSNLPRDFQIAWQKHIDAWRDYADFLNEQKNSNSNDEDSEENGNFHTNEINRTWEDVLLIGENYGAYTE